MKTSAIDTLVELGRRLTIFTEGGNETPGIVERAVAANPWFMPAEIRRAAASIAEDMLSREALTEWMAGYPALSLFGGRDPVTPRKASSLNNVLIVMAGNIPFVGMQDLVCVLAAGCRATVKPSSKDAVLMSWVVSELLAIDPELPVSLFSNDESSLDASFMPAAVIAMGGDDAVAAIREKYFDVPALLRGNRWSLAVLSGHETTEELSALADDILSYSGLGCRNVSLIFVPHGYDFHKLQSILSERKRSLNIKYRNNYIHARALLQMNGATYTDCHSCMMLENRDFPSDISVLNYDFYDDLHDVSDWLHEHNSEVQCIVSGRDIDGNIIVDFGQTQRPGLLDYSDGLDTMIFLSKL